MNNDNVYEKLSEDATDDNVCAVEEIVNNMLLVGDIEEVTAEYLIPNEAKPSRFYTLPKTHKVKPGSDVLPVRPVISGCGSATERLSEFVDYHLKPFVPKLKSFVKDSKHLIRKIEDINAKGPLPEGSSLFTIDVVAMYPSIPKDLGLKAAKEALNQREIKKPSTENLLKCLQICLKYNTFEFNNNHFKQIQGTAIGPKMSPSYACLAMGLVDKRMWSEAPRTPEEWDRYIDDVFGIWVHGEEEFSKFLDFLNSLYPDVLKFTGDFGGPNGLPFLDTFLTIVQGQIVSQLYVKPTDKHLYLRFESCHPVHSKNSIAYSQALRVSLLNSSEDQRDSDFQDLKQHLVNRGHPEEKVSSQIGKAKAVCREEIIKEKPKKKNNRVPFVTSYNPALPNLSSVIRKHYHVLQGSERLKDIFNEPPIVAFRKPKSIKQLLVRAKVNKDTDFNEANTEIPGCFKLHNKNCKLCHVLKQTDSFSSTVTNRTYKIKQKINCKSKGVIYLITCQDCNKQYVGETGTAFSTRHYGHRSDIQKKPNLPLSKHFLLGNCSFERISIVGIELHKGDVNSRKQKEGWWQHQLKTTQPLGINNREEYFTS